MELLTTFMDEEVLANDPPSPWVKITSSQCSPKGWKRKLRKPLRDWSCSRCQRAHPQGSFLMPCFLGCSRPLVVSMMASTSTTTIPSQSSAVPNIFTQWVKTPLGSPGMQRWEPPPRFVGITKSSPKMETPLESTGAPLWTPPSGFVEIASTLRRSQTSQPHWWRNRPYPRWWDPLWWWAGWSRTCMGDNDHWHDDMSVKNDGPRAHTTLPHHHHQRNASWAVHSRRYLRNRGLKRFTATSIQFQLHWYHIFPSLAVDHAPIFCRAVSLKHSHTIELLICCSYRLFCLNVILS